MIRNTKHPVFFLERVMRIFVRSAPIFEQNTLKKIAKLLKLSKMISFSEILE